MDKKSVLGESGVKVMVLEGGGEKTAYIILDANDMVIGFRDEILNADQKTGVDFS